MKIYRIVLLVALTLVTAICLAKKKELKEKPSEAISPVRKITEKEAAELASYKIKQPLIEPLAQIPGAPNRFNKDTLYIMKNFHLLQKIKGGYLITAEPVVWSSGNSMDFGVAFLKTNKILPEDILITGIVVYDGQFKYDSTKGFPKEIPRVKIPANMPLSGIHKDGDPFSPEYF